VKRVPATERFQIIPRFYAGCVYAVELTNGIVKVGWSRNPRTRMESLVWKLRKEFRTGIARFFIGRDIPSELACKAENDVIKRISKIGNVLPKRREYFTGVSFGHAVNLISQFSRRAEILATKPRRRADRQPA